MTITVGCPQTNRKTDTGKTLKPWPVLVDHYTNGTRKIIDKNETFAELLKLTGMVNSIVTEVLREITGQPTEYYTPAKGILLIKQAVY